MEIINEIAARIRELREVCDYTQEKLAKELDLTTEQYAAYEEHGDFPISVIYEIANKFGVDFNELVTGEPSRIDTYHVVRRGNGKSISRYEGYRFKDLAFRYADKIMQPLLVTIEPSDEPAKLVKHAGQKAILSTSTPLTHTDSAVSATARQDFLQLSPNNQVFDCNTKEF